MIHLTIYNTAPQIRFLINTFQMVRCRLHFNSQSKVKCICKLYYFIQINTNLIQNKKIVIVFSYQHLDLYHGSYIISIMIHTQRCVTVGKTLDSESEGLDFNLNLLLSCFPLEGEKKLLYPYSWDNSCSQECTNYTVRIVCICVCVCVCQVFKVLWFYYW